MIRISTFANSCIGLDFEPTSRRHPPTPTSSPSPAQIDPSMLRVSFEFPLAPLVSALLNSPRCTSILHLACPSIVHIGDARGSALVLRVGFRLRFPFRSSLSIGMDPGQRLPFRPAFPLARHHVSERGATHGRWMARE